LIKEVTGKKESCFATLLSAMLLSTVVWLLFVTGELQLATRKKNTGNNNFFIHQK
jgi:hypothetical protein